MPTLYIAHSLAVGKSKVKAYLESRQIFKFDNFPIKKISSKFKIWLILKPKKYR